MLDPKKLLDDLLGTTVPGTGATVREAAGQAAQLARQNPIATGAIAAILLGTGAGRAVTGGAIKAGGLAAIAGLAYHAWQSHRQGMEPGAQTPPAELPPPAGTDFDPAGAPQGQDEFALALARAMIAAARADGHVDEAERGRIADRLRLSGLDEEEQAFLIDELERPVDLDLLVAAARTDAQKVELYTASRLAIEPRTRAERGYLDLLAGRLGLPDALVEHIEATVSQVTADTPAARSDTPGPRQR